MTIYDEVTIEGAKAIQKHEPQSHPNGTGDSFTTLANWSRRQCDQAFKKGELTWLHILREEFYEAAAEEDPAKLRAELIQVMSVARHWISDIDAKNGAPVRSKGWPKGGMVVHVDEAPGSPADAIRDVVGGPFGPAAAAAALARYRNRRHSL